MKSEGTARKNDFFLMDPPIAPSVEYKGQFAKFSRHPEAPGFLILPVAGVEGTDHKSVV